VFSAEREFFRCVRPHFVVQKKFGFFEIYGVSARTRGVNFSRFCAVGPQETCNFPTMQPYSSVNVLGNRGHQFAAVALILLTSVVVLRSTASDPCASKVT